jgi:hypothetical protein
MEKIYLSPTNESTDLIPGFTFPHFTPYYNESLELIPFITLAQGRYTE